MCFVRTSQAMVSVSEYWMMRPFFDQEIHVLPGMNVGSGRLNTRMTLGASAFGGFDTLHTRRSPSAVWVASISDFCLDEDACQLRESIGDGARLVISVCMIVKDGCRDASRIDPLLYPIAYVLQSEAGPIAVIGSKMVRAETCSLVEGSNKITSPLPLPASV